MLSTDGGLLLALLLVGVLAALVAGVPDMLWEIITAPDEDEIDGEDGADH